MKFFKNSFTVMVFTVFGAVIVGCGGNGTNLPRQINEHSELQEQNVYNTSQLRLTPMVSGIASVTQSTVCSPTGTVTGSITCHFPQTPNLNDIILVGTGVSLDGQARTVASPVGFTAFTPSVGGPYDKMAAFWKSASSNETNSYTFTTQGGDYFNGIAYDISGVAATNTIFANSGIYGNNTGTISSYSTISNAPAGSLGITFLSPNNGNVSGISTGWQSGVSATSTWHPVYSWIYTNFPSSATGWSGTTTADAGGRVIVIAPGTAATPTPTSTPATFSTSYRNTNFPPVGWDNQVTTGPNDAPDSSRINWSKACSDHLISNCNGSDPPYDSNSSNIVTAAFGGTNSLGVANWCSDEGYTSTANEQQGSAFCQSKDTTVGVYFANATDPLYKATVTIYPPGGYGLTGPGSSFSGTSYNIEPGAIPNIGNDGHLLVVNESSHIECDVWNAWSPHEAGGLKNFTTSSGGAFNVGNGSCGSLDADHDGEKHYFSAFASNVNVLRYLLRPDEWVLAAQNIANPGKAIPHALYMSWTNNSSQHTPAWPASSSDGQCSNGVGQEGMYLYLDTAGYTAMMASSISPYRKAIFATFHNFANNNLDSSGCSGQGSQYNNFLTWDPLLWLHNGMTNPLDTVVTNDATDIHINYGGKDSSDVTYLFTASLANTGMSLDNFHILKQSLAKCLVVGPRPCS